MYQLTIAGRLGADAETRTTQGGNEVTTFRVATDVRNGKQKETKWTTAVMWGDRGKAVQPFLTKGTVVAVTGQLDVREHDGKHYVEIKNADVTLLGGNKREDAPTDRESKRGGGAAGGRHPAEDDSEIPFGPEQ